MLLLLLLPDSVTVPTATMLANPEPWIPADEPTAVSTATVTRPAVMRGGRILRSPCDVGMFMFMPSLLYSVLDLVEADTQSDGLACCWIVARLAFLGRKPLVNALEKNLGFLFEHLGECRRGTGGHSIIDRGAFQ